MYKAFKSLQHGDSTTALGSLCQCLRTLPVKEFPLIFNLNFPWCNQAISLCPTTFYLGEEIDPHLTALTYIYLSMYVSQDYPISQGKSTS